MAAANVVVVKPIEEMVKGRKLDRSSKDSPNMSPPKDGAALSDATSCISSVDAVCSTKEIESDQEVSFATEQPVYYPVNSYYGYYYPGCEMPYMEWEDQGYLVGTDGLEMPQAVVHSDNGSLVCYMPGFQPGYNPYTAYIPGNMIGVDGQYVAQPQYPASPMSQSLGSPVYYPPSMGYGPEMIPAYGWESSAWNYSNGNGFIGNVTMPATKPKYSAKYLPSKPASNTKSTLVETKGSVPVLELPPRVEIPNQSVKLGSKTSTPLKGYFPVPKMSPFSYQGKDGLSYPNSPVNMKENGRSWAGTDKLKTRSKTIGFGGVDLLNEQNRGPRTNNLQITSISGADHSGVPVSELEDKCGNKTLIIKRDDYNLTDFPTKYEQALFFVIKSYSEDDIHKSIKYNVWASTPNGNKRLDSAFQAAQDKMMEKGCKCPVFLFFSVNASGQFCGVAEMVGRVDFNKNMEFWQQDKWTGFFPVKWHIIKDVPNPQFRHIILENNDNKPVTNSRDTQEVKFTQGSEMLNIFKNFSFKTSILDDFSFYENRQKVMQDKRIKMPAPLEHFLPKVDDTKLIVSGMEAFELGSVKMALNEHQVAAAE